MAKLSIPQLKKGHARVNSPFVSI